MMNRSTITKWLATAGVAGALVAASAAPTLADRYGYRDHHPVGAAVGGVVGGAVAGATALATAPFHGPYGHGPYAYDYRPGYDAYAYDPAPFGNSAEGQCATQGAQGRTWHVC